jgi:hypothetical protein
MKRPLIILTHFGESTTYVTSVLTQKTSCNVKPSIGHIWFTIELFLSLSKTHDLVGKFGSLLKIL